MSIVFAISFGPRENRRYLCRPLSSGLTENGWRPFVWTRDKTLAENFDTSAEADAFAKSTLVHVSYEVIGMPPMNRPGTDNPAGTPAAMAVAA